MWLKSLFDFGEGRGLDGKLILKIKQNDDIEMDFRQAGIVYRPIVSLAGVADSGDTGEN